MLWLVLDPDSWEERDSPGFHYHLHPWTAAMDREAKQRELEQLRGAVHRLERELALEPQSLPWPPKGYYWAYHILGGCVLGMAGAALSLLFNLVGSLFIGQDALQLIRVYLTFPLGAVALTTHSNVALAIGCCLYLGTGMLLGVPIHLVLTRFFASASFTTRLVVASAISLALWLFNYYGVLYWLQPLLFGDRWIVREIPWWVAAATHLVFGWTVVILQPLGTFVPYHEKTERA
jgi:hypothetical protein